MSFEDLEVWKRAVALSAELYKALRDLRDYGFKDQLTRAGLSVASNIDGEIGRRWIKESQEISAMLVGLSRSIKV